VTNSTKLFDGAIIIKHSRLIIGAFKGAVYVTAYVIPKRPENRREQAWISRYARRYVYLSLCLFLFSTIPTFLPLSRFRRFLVPLD